MNVTQLNPVIQSLYNSGRTGMLWGAPGIGKSASFKAAAKEIAKSLGLTGPVLERHQIRDYARNGGNMRQAFGLFDLRLSQMDPVEVGGLPRENSQNGTMEKLPPAWFAHTGRDDLPDFGILLLEELPSAPLSVQTTAYQITLDGIIDDFRLKEGWSCFAAGNRLSDGGQHFKMPNALANRMCHIDVESDVDSWVEWAVDNGMDHSLIAFIRFRPDLLNTYDEHVKGKLKGHAFATERAWEGVNDFLKAHSTVGANGMMVLNADAATATAVTTGLVGPAALEFEGFRRVWHAMPNIDGIIMNPDVATIPEDAATMFAVMTALASKASYNNLQNCFKYTDRVTAQGKAEMSVLFVRDMQRRDSIAQAKAKEEGTQYQPAVTSPAFSAWSTKNAQLFM